MILGVGTDLIDIRRIERTTEGGLDAVKQRAQLKPVVHALKAAGIRVSLFIAAEPAQIEAAAALQAPVIEIHTGAWCEALAERLGAELRRLLAFVLDLLRDYGLNDFYLELSTRDDVKEKFVGSDEDWEQATAELQHAAEESGLELVADPGEGNPKA